MRNYWWLEMTKYVGKYVDRCGICQRIKNQTEIPAGKLRANKVLERPQTYLTVDFITKLLLLAGKYVILVVCDRFFKMAYFVITVINKRDISRRFDKVVQ